MATTFKFKHIFIPLTLALLLSASFVVSAPKAEAQTSEPDKAQIAALIAQVKQLQAILNQLLVARNTVPNPVGRVATATAGQTANAASEFGGYDIIIVAGQSNAVSSGLLSGTPSAYFRTDHTIDDNILQLGRYGSNNNKVIPTTRVAGNITFDALQFWSMDYALNATGDTVTNNIRFGFAMPFARKYAEEQLASNRKVLIIPAAYGGTTILKWLGEIDVPQSNPASLYQDMLTRTKYALENLPGNNRVVAFLWLQGESDVVEAEKRRFKPYSTLKAGQYDAAAALYGTKLKSLINQVRTDLPSTTPYPFIGGHFGPTWPSNPYPNWQALKPYATAIEKIIDSTIGADAHSGIVSTVGLTVNYPSKSSTVTDWHFDADSMVTLGERYYEEWKKIQAQGAGDILGHVDVVDEDAEGVYVAGWACQQGVNQELAVHLYAGADAFHGGKFVMDIGKTNTESSAAINNLCKTSGVNHRFYFNIPNSILKEHSGQKLYAHAIRAVKNGQNSALGNSGTFTFPEVTSTEPSCTLGVSPSSITSGQSAFVAWQTKNASSISIDHGVGQIPARHVDHSSRSVSPTQTTTYTATVTGTNGSAATCSTTLHFSRADSGISVSAPLTVAQNADINTNRTYGGTRTIDGSYPVILKNGQQYWYNENSFTWAKYKSSPGDIFGKSNLVWHKQVKDLFTNVPNYPPQTAAPDGQHDRYWFVNAYQPNTTGNVLAFVHVERGYSYTKNGQQAYDGGQNRVGLAWSTDYGDTFKYLGHIAIPYGDPNVNVSGVPYIIKKVNGVDYFYVYYSAKCELAGTEGVDPPVSRPSGTVVRAKVSDVISAAKSGKVVQSDWKKYYNGAWNEPADASGRCTELWPSSHGLIHADAAKSTYDNKFYMVRNMPKDSAGPNGNAFLRLYRSDDGINWDFVKDVITPTKAVNFGYSYQTITDADGTDNGTVGARFYVYSDKDAAAGRAGNTNGTIERWLVDLGGGSVAQGPTCTLSASPSSITEGQSSTLTWTSQNASSAFLSHGFGTVNENGSQQVSPDVSTTYGITVTGAGGERETCGATVDVSSGGGTNNAEPPNTFTDHFGSARGNGNWYYQYSSGGLFSNKKNMQWDSSNNRWKGDEQYTLIGDGWLSPGVNSNALLIWLAPKDGKVKISGNVRKPQNCGDGASVLITRNGSTLWGRNLDKDGSDSFSLTTDVSEGNGIYFIVTKGPAGAGSDNVCDVVRLNPTIEYQSVAKAPQANTLIANIYTGFVALMAWLEGA